MSDCRRGWGNTSHNFLQSQTLFLGALEYYLEKGFTYIELGDGDELWKNRTTEQIIEAHSDALSKLKAARSHLSNGRSVPKRTEPFMWNARRWKIRRS